jgi:hypothetical protein
MNSAKARCLARCSSRGFGGLMRTAPSPWHVQTSAHHVAVDRRHWLAYAYGIKTVPGPPTRRRAGRSRLLCFETVERPDDANEEVGS